MDDVARTSEDGQLYSSTRLIHHAIGHHKKAHLIILSEHSFFLGMARPFQYPPGMQPRDPGIRRFLSAMGLPGPSIYQWITTINIIMIDDGGARGRAKEGQKGKNRRPDDRKALGSQGQVAEGMTAHGCGRTQQRSPCFGERRRGCQSKESPSAAPCHQWLPESAPNLPRRRLRFHGSRAPSSSAPWENNRARG